MQIRKKMRICVPFSIYRRSKQYSSVLVMKKSYWKSSYSDPFLNKLQRKSSVVSNNLRQKICNTWTLFKFNHNNYISQLQNQFDDYFPWIYKTGLQDWQKTNIFPWLRDRNGCHFSSISRSMYFNVLQICKDLTL